MHIHVHIQSIIFYITKWQRLRTKLYMYIHVHVHVSVTIQGYIYILGILIDSDISAIE